MPKFSAGVVKKLAGNKIRALKLEGPLLYEQLCELCAVLKGNTSCRKLDLDGCYLGQFCPIESCFDPDRADGLVQLLGMLRVNRTIEELDLQNNGLGEWAHTRKSADSGRAGAYACVSLCRFSNGRPRIQRSHGGADDRNAMRRYRLPQPPAGSSTRRQPTSLRQVRARLDPGGRCAMHQS